MSEIPKFEIVMDKIKKKMFLETNDEEWIYPIERNCHAFYWSTQISMTLNGVLTKITPWNEEFKAELTKQIILIFEKAISNGDLKLVNGKWCWKVVNWQPIEEQGDE